jgi:predicted DNA-binding protein (UPF0251 family)
MKYEFHPFTEIFPMMPSHEIDELAADIKKHGQRVPIVLYGGKILDGRNRYVACQRLKIEPRVVQFTKANPKEYVYSVNLFRRHLSTSERAKIAALMSIESEAGRPSEETAPNDAVMSQTEAAKTMGVSRRSVQRANTKIQGKTKPPDQSLNGAVMDDSGFEVPEAARKYWDRKPEARNVLNQISAARGQVKKLLADDPMWCEVNLNGVIADLSGAFNRFAAAVPSHVCPYCKGQKPDNCKGCKGRGVVSKYMWSMIPEELRKMREIKGTLNGRISS